MHILVTQPLLGGVWKSMFTPIEMSAKYRSFLCMGIGSRKPAMRTHQGWRHQFLSLRVFRTLLEMEIFQFVLSCKPFVTMETSHPFALFRVGFLRAIVKMPLSHCAGRSSFLRIWTHHLLLNIFRKSLSHFWGHDKASHRNG